MGFAAILGGALAFYLIYALLALFIKHRNALIASGILWLMTGIMQIVVRADFFVLIASIVGFLAVCLIKPIQINSPEKLAEKQAKQKAQQKSKNKDQNDK